MSWVAATDCVRGNGHFKTGKPCQDSADFRIVGDGRAVIACVADGGGSAELSEIGSKITVAFMLHALTARVPALLEAEDSGDALPDQDSMKDMWISIVADIRACIRAEASQMRTSEKHFGTTLLAALATEKRTYLMQIGDGFIVYVGESEVAPDANKFQLAFEPHNGEYVGQTVWITSSEWQEVLDCAILEPVEFLCLSSDGVENVALQRPGYIPFPGYFNLPYEKSKELRPGDRQGFLSDMLRDKRLDTETDDDKSMVVAARVEL